MGITTIDQVLKMGIVEEVLLDFLSESTDNDCEKQLSKEETKKYARMFRSEYKAVQRWANRRVAAESRLKRAPRRWKKRVQRRVDFAEKMLEHALEVFSQKVNEA